MFTKTNLTMNSNMKLNRVKRHEITSAYFRQ